MKETTSSVLWTAYIVVHKLPHPLPHPTLSYNAAV